MAIAIAAEYDVTLNQLKKIAGEVPVVMSLSPFPTCTSVTRSAFLYVNFFHRCLNLVRTRPRANSRDSRPKMKQGQGYFVAERCNNYSSATMSLSGDS